MEKKFGGRHKNTVIKDLLIKKTDHTEAPIPLNPVGRFHPQFKNIKLVFGISGTHITGLKEPIGNIYYIIRYAEFNHIPYKIRVVLYGGMAYFLNKRNPNYGWYIKKMRKFNKEGVKFYVCYNALLVNGLIRHVIPSFIKPVPMGLLEIYRLRKKGYMYFTD
jgi:intracellular sulfur oxidation DsrE/DsrF family protein